MSEFVEVMRQARRLCETKKCRECPLANRDPSIGIAMCMLHPSKNSEDDVDYAEVGSVIMQWAEEHPEPVYPSWAEGWKQLFPAGENIPCLGLFDTKYYDGACMERSCAKCKNAPMPAEVAEKLGIKPKEE